MKQDKQNEKQSEISKIKQSNDNKLEIAQELHVSKNIGNMLGDRIDKKKMNRPS
ncbi:TPA: DNA polymerase III [Clostridioides difficile]|nr:DNA polymerase III [Clostridioides difficile]HBF2449777.1 DNA polymerase III [Clostridioides difficile]HBF6974697.1 DNA polymerase III [Clostridioides difficile]HBG4410196.1 DNA polymerase III [Clostridioides difficile]HBG4553269.1 DNA polymerase III [Clostridioides difficile]